MLAAQVPLFVGFLCGYEKVSDVSLSTTEKRVSFELKEISSHFMHTKIVVFVHPSDSVAVSVIETAHKLGHDVWGVLSNSSSTSRMETHVAQSCDRLLHQKDPAAWMVHHAQFIIVLQANSDTTNSPTERPRVYNTRSGARPVMGKVTQVNEHLQRMMYSASSGYTEIDSESVKRPFYYEPVVDVITVDIGSDNHVDQRYNRTVQRSSRNTLDVLSAIDRFNGDVIWFCRNDEIANQKKLLQSRKYMFTDESDMLRCSAVPDVDCLLSFYSLSDTLALSFQSRKNSLLSMFFRFFAVTAFVYPLINFDSRLLSLYFIFLAGLSWFRRSIDQGNVETKHLDYRAMAEALRISIYWRLSGIQSKVYDAYPDKYAGNMIWVCIAVQNIDLLASSLNSNANHLSPSRRKIQIKTESPLSDGVAVAQRNWVLGQANYFRKKPNILSQKLQEMNIYSRAGSSASFVFAGILTCCTFLFEADDSIWLTTVSALIGLCNAVTAVTGMYMKKEEIEPLARNFEKGAILFERAVTCCDNALKRGDEQVVQQVIFELGREALFDSAEWMWTLHQAQFESLGF
eukprot:GILK01014481.1.p1 GENE.GILK01014481.1~~GILK01014481.1.p1  ORF type:complete len:571 (+),score=92.29 GILK01014481.1:68-1780(+)